MEHVAEIRSRLRLSRIGPKQERQVLAGLRRLPMEENIGEERGGAGGLERRQGYLTAAQVELAE